MGIVVLRVYCCLLLRYKRFLFPRRKIQFQDRVGGTYRCAFTAEPAFVIYYKREVVLNGDGIERALFLAFTTPDASHGTCFFRDGPFVFVHATHEDTSRFRALFS